MLLALAIAVGIFFRFYNLDRKLYWGDEVFTSLRISGYTEADFYRAFYDGRVVALEELQAFQGPGAEWSVLGTIRGLAVEKPEHVPLYFLAARSWVELLGNFIAARRALSALASVATILGVYWLGRELFGSARTGQVAAALVALSPFHVQYAQQARPYALWALLVVLASALLLRALRLDRRRLWILYGQPWWQPCTCISSRCSSCSPTPSTSGYRPAWPERPFQRGT